MMLLAFLANVLMACHAGLSVAAMQQVFTPTNEYLPQPYGAAGRFLATHHTSAFNADKQHFAEKHFDNERHYKDPHGGIVHEHHKKTYKTHTYKTHHGKKDYRTYTYVHSEPHYVPDPDLHTVNYNPPLALNGLRGPIQPLPLFLGAQDIDGGHVMPGDYMLPPQGAESRVEPQIVKPSEQKGSSTITTSKSTSTSTTTTSTTKAPAHTTKDVVADKATATTNQETVAPTEEKYISAMQFPGKIKSVNPEEDIMYINHNHGPNTEYDLFNAHETYALDTVLPVVIFKPGDDTSFADDLTMFDNYEHTFPPKAMKDMKDATTMTPPMQTADDQAFMDNTRDDPEIAAPAESKREEQRAAAATKTQGYFYEKPLIPFDF